MKGLLFYEVFLILICLHFLGHEKVLNVRSKSSPWLHNVMGVTPFDVKINPFLFNSLTKVKFG